MRMALQQRGQCGDAPKDSTIEELKRLDALLEYAVAHGETDEAERIRAELRRFAETV